MPLILMEYIKGNYGVSNKESWYLSASVRHMESNICNNLSTRADPEGFRACGYSLKPLKEYGV
jgi:hypothetical protein